MSEQCSHCPRNDDSVHEYREVDAQRQPTGQSDWMCDDCFFALVPFSFAGDAIDRYGLLVDNEAKA